MANILHLPLEILLFILRHLDLSAYLAIVRVHSTFYNLFKSSPEVNYRFASLIADVVDNPNCDLSTSKRAQILKNRESAWSQLEFDFHTDIEVHHNVPEAIPVGIVDGICIMGDADAPTLHYFLLPSSPNNSPVWSRIDLDDKLEYEILAVDFSLYDNDLVAFATARPTSPASEVCLLELQFLQFSTKKSHPLAQVPTLLIGETSRPQDMIVGLKLVGDYVAVLISDDPEEFGTLRVINWIASNVHLTCRPGAFANDGITFLTRNSILLTDATNMSLNVYLIPNEPTVSTTTEPLPFMILLLPRRHPHSFVGLQSHDDTCILSTVEAQHSSKPFHVSTFSAILMLYIDFSDGIEGIIRDRFSVFVHRSSLVQLFAACDATPAPTTIEWEDWGPSMTRWFYSSEAHLNFAVLAGQRSAFTESSNELTILDFNPLNVKSALVDQKENFEDIDVLDLNDDRLLVYVQEDILRLPMFQQEIKHTLPFTHITRNLDNLLDGFIIDEERLIRIVENEEGTVSKIIVSHFGDNLCR